MTRSILSLVLIPLFWITGFATGAQGPSCAKQQHEIAFVEPTTKGAFKDATYHNRALTPNTSICSDSHIIHGKDGKETLDDQLVLRGLLGGVFPPFRCGDNLNCNNPNHLRDIIHARLRPQLQGKSLRESFAAFLSRKSAQTSTLPRGVGASSHGQLSMSAALLPAGSDIAAAILFPHGLPADLAAPPQFDICLNAERVDCGATLPKPVSLPFRAVPPGLHIIWEAKPLPGDTMPIRVDGNVTFVIAAHTSWTQQDLAEARAVWSSVMTSPQFKAEQLRPFLVEFATRLSQPRKP